MSASSPTADFTSGFAISGKCHYRTSLTVGTEGYFKRAKSLIIKGTRAIGFEVHTRPSAGPPQDELPLDAHDKPTMTYGLYSGGNSLAVKRVAIEKLSYMDADQ